MAEVVGGALLSAFLDPLVQKLASEVKDFFKGKDAILMLLKELKTLLSTADLLLIDAEDKLIKDHKVRKWLDDLKEAIYDADDLVYMVDTEAWRNKLKGESHSISSYACYDKVLMKLIPTPFTSFDKAIKPELEETLGKLKHLLENKDLGLERLKKQKFPERTCAPSLEESDIYGRSDEKEEIVKLLLLDGTVGGEKLSVISIVGMGGIGKTTLAQLVLKDEGVSKAFDTIVWITVGDDKLDCLKMMKLIVEKVTCKKCDIEEPYDLQEEVKKALRMKKFLFVVDDVWDEDHSKWDVLHNCFKSGLHGSKIIVTTRSTIVASVMTTGTIFQLNRISDNDSWQLFAKHALLSNYSDLQEIGKKIVDKCKGLPLAIKSIGGVLRGKYNKEEWDNILKNDIWELYERKNVSVLPALWLSYFYLPSELKSCFAYLSIFPKDYEFEKEEVILLWTAEGLLHSRNRKRVEEVGEEYFQDLISKSFFQPSNEHKLVFRMHDLVHDLAMFISGEFCSTMHVNKYSHKARHLSDMQDFEYCSEFEHLDKLFKAKYLRTLLLSQKVRFHRVWFSKIDHLHKSLPRLRVLSIENPKMVMFPRSICKLQYLRYLKLSCAMIEKLPSSLCNLYNLEILLLKGCDSLIRLPTDIGNLIKLRHLCIPIWFEEMPLQLPKLQNLQNLNRFVLGMNKDFGLKLLMELQGLHRSLCITRLENVSSVEEVPEGIFKRKKFLSQLCLEWDMYHNPYDKCRERKILSALEPHPNLKELKIVNYKGDSFPNWIGDYYLSYLVRVDLIRCDNCMFLPPLGLLPSLKDLVIFGMESVVRIDSKFYYSSAATQTKPFFRSLENLTVRCMKELQEWSFVEDGVFPRLKELSFISCGKLKVSLFPDHFPKLEKLVIDHCKQLMPLLPTAQPMHSSLSSLQYLEITGCDGQTLILEGGLPLSLKNIVIKSCYNLKCLENKAFKHLSSLEKLQIKRCVKLQRLPKELPASLSDLSIENCTLLSPQLRRETGRDWPVIAHIPNVTIQN